MQHRKTTMNNLLLEQWQTLILSLKAVAGLLVAIWIMLLLIYWRIQ
jgi:hypothetical protein